MNGMQDIPIGERIKLYRRRRGLSQPRLAQLIGRSESWLSQVERGVRSVDRFSTIIELARVLRVQVVDLTGRPLSLAPNGGAHFEAVDGRPPTAWPMPARSATPAAKAATTTAATPPWPASSAWTPSTWTRLAGRPLASPTPPPPATPRC
jgi:transcriptional regulator with XRE-family HTH domain